MTLISTFDLDYNETAVTESGKFPTLTTGAIGLSIAVDNVYYTAQILYNSVTKWLTLKILDTSGNILQGETFVNEFPTNLLVCNELIGYGLFYFPKANQIRFYKLDEDWYNSIDLDYDTAYKAILLQVFPSEILEK